MVNQVIDKDVRTGTNFSAVNFGAMSDLDSYLLQVPAFKREVRGKLFIKEALAFTGMQVSLNKLPVGGQSPYHQHKENEEAYIFVGGTGQMNIDGEVIDVEEGTVVRVATKGARSVRNNSDAPLYFICVQANEGSINIDTFEDGIRQETPAVWPA